MPGSEFIVQSSRQLNKVDSGQVEIERTNRKKGGSATIFFKLTAEL